MPADAAHQVPHEDSDGAPLPTFVIAGTMRSGTTALARWLGAHPDVYMAPRKELHYFDSAKPKTMADYRREFAGRAGQRAVGEATPNYVFADHAVERLATAVPDVRVIVSCREPVERAYSHYWARRSRVEELREFAEVVAEEQRHPDTPAGTGLGTSLDLLARGRYLEQIEEALRHLRREQLLVVLFDDVEQRPAQTFTRICTHIGVDPSLVPDDVGRPANGYRAFRSERLRRVTRRVPGRAADVLGRLNTRATAYPELDPGLRRELQDWYRPANHALADWLGRDLSAWDR